jgi:hypothetical protein
MLMVVASRRKGDCEVGLAWRLVGHPVVVAITSLLFLAALLLHGLVIWEDPYQRVAALLVATATATACALAVRRGAFQPRTVVELRVEPTAREPAVVNVVSAGEPVSAAVHLVHRDAGYTRLSLNGELDLGRLSAAVIELSPSPVRELKVWAHRMTPEGISEGLPAALVLMNGDGGRQFDLAASEGQVIVAISGEPQRLEISLSRT